MKGACHSTPFADGGFRSGFVDMSRADRPFVTFDQVLDCVAGITASTPMPLLKFAYQGPVSWRFYPADAH
eukprot:885932-Prymnesium_polylepis.1